MAGLVGGNGWGWHVAVSDAHTGHTTHVMFLGADGTAAAYLKYLAKEDAWADAPAIMCWQVRNVG